MTNLHDIHEEKKYIVINNFQKIKIFDTNKTNKISFLSKKEKNNI